jgi:hypothetical protein
MTGHVQSHCATPRKFLKPTGYLWLCDCGRAWRLTHYIDPFESGRAWREVYDTNLGKTLSRDTVMEHLT